MLVWVFFVKAIYFKIFKHLNEVGLFNLLQSTCTATSAFAVSWYAINWAYSSQLMTNHQHRYKL